ncbi:methyl-accepting chemotaxis protein [Colwellia echini]|uniref:Methyl-accepting chemotaxis protein n=1 Tax=Colwellia echini TaxID=1982103 RepID=A0ABY3MUH4_9GAMM|nr:methyl-accepting chemotaxis protein [Colwellia echini]TYK64848.1 methyl-accepting chemotaxis protein [Colwellia echini]
MKKLGFKQSLILIITLLLISSLLIMSLFSYNLLRQNAEDDLIKRVQSSIKAESNVISSYILQHSEPAKGLAELYEKYDYQTAHEKLAEVAAFSTGVSKITIAFDDGSSFVSKPSNSTFPGGIGIKEKYDPRVRAWYQKGKNSSGLILSDIFFTKENVPMFGALHTIKGGVILSDIRLGQLQSVLEGVDIMDGAVGVIVDEKGMILASTADYASVRGNLSDTPVFKESAGNILSTSKLMTNTKVDGKDTLLFSNRIDLLGDSEMFLIVALDSKTAYASVTKQTSILLTTMLIIVIVSSIILVLFLNYLYRPVLELRRLTDNLSSGECDLTQRLAVKSDDDLGRIAQGVNSFIETIQENMLSIEILTNDISTGVSELQQQTNKSRDVLSEHVTQTNTVAVSMQELSASAQQVAGSATEAANLVNSANHRGESSRNIISGAQRSISTLVNEIDTAAQNVEKMSQETKDINSVLSVIGSIAEQTNLLALNAAIEAARAGEQGRGFAVVADEVRALAARTQQSTSEIESSLSKLRSGADTVVQSIDGTRLTSQSTASDVHQISESTEELLKEVNQVDQISSEISLSANEQSRVIDSISESVSNIHTMVEELTTSGQDISKETESISNVNVELTQIVNRFILK